MQNYILTIILFLLISPIVKAQEEEFSPQYTVGFVPQYLIINGLRTDIEIRLKKENHWLQVGPQVYYYENPDSYWFYDDFNKLSGLGLDLHHKIYLGKNQPAQGPYLSYGAVYQNYSIQYSTLGWEEYEESGLTYHEYLESVKKGSIHKTGINLLFGYQLNPYERLMIDLYIGAGLRKSFSNEIVKDRFDESMTDYNYSGTLLVIGVRFGALL
jgi:hypothetical protein